MKFYDVIIIGGGPAGLTCGQYCARAGRKTAIIDNCDSQMLSISRVENYPGVKEISGSDLLNIFTEQAEAFGCEIIFGEVTEIEKQGDWYLVSDGEEEYKARAVVLAMGCEHKHLNIPGEKEFTGKGVSYCATCDGPFFKDKRIYVVGGGDSACQEATYLTKYSKDVTIIHRRGEFFRAQKAIVDKMIDAGVKTLMNTSIKAIHGKDFVKSIVISEGDEFNNEWRDIPADAVFIFAGMSSRDNIKISNCAFSAGIFMIGDVRNLPFKQIVTAAADGALASRQIEEYLNTLK